MDFQRVIREVLHRFDREEIPYALIGGFAMALRGVQRATMDIDLLLMLEALERADRIFDRCGYHLAFRSENVSHYQSPDWEWGRVDVLHAFRGPSLGMLQRADLVDVEPGLKLKVARTEDIIGLKIQALSNDKSRAEGDWSDIRLLIRAAADQELALDWPLVRDYLGIFGLGGEFEKLRANYGTTFE